MAMDGEVLNDSAEASVVDVTFGFSSDCVERLNKMVGQIISVEKPNASRTEI